MSIKPPMIKKNVEFWAVFLKSILVKGFWSLNKIYKLLVSFKKLLKSTTFAITLSILKKENEKLVPSSFLHLTVQS